MGLSEPSMAAGIGLMIPAALLLSGALGGATAKARIACLLAFLALSVTIGCLL